MDFEKFTPQTLRFAIEKELQKFGDTKTASIIALKRLQKDPEYYHKEYGYVELEKARLTKYYKRVPKPGGGYKYYYTEDEYKKSKKPSLISAIMFFFGIKSEELAIYKIKFDYDRYDVSNKFNIDVNSWTKHLNEYFENRNKWQNFFSKEKKIVDKKTDKKKIQKKESTGKRKTISINLSVMKFINDIYGDKTKEIEPSEKTLKEKDQEISEAINETTPENRYEKEREILGIPEPTEGEENEVLDEQQEQTAFTPDETTISIVDRTQKTFPVIEVPAKDYTKVVSKDIYLVSDKDILNKSRPNYIPEIDEDFFKYTRYFLPTMKLDKDKYAIQTQQKTRLASTDTYVIVNRDVLAAMQDYYFKKAKAQADIEHIEKEKKYNTKLKKKRLAMISKNKMTRIQSSFINKFESGLSSKKIWEIYDEIRDDLRQKTEDMQIQIEEFYNSHAKGRDTAYGDKGTKNNLLEDYGIKVKRQNGEEINDREINEIKNAMDDLYSVFGNRSNMARNFDLKISHSGDVLMHARKAAGIFISSMRAIGVSAKYGEKNTGFILAHEWGHFMDYYIGDKSGKHYISDNPDSTAGEIADRFRTRMVTPQKSKYQNRTCECFARAMEQYWAIKTDNRNILAEWDEIGNHPPENIFKSDIMPLIDKFMDEQKELLKAFYKLQNKYYKTIKKENL